ncbi:Transcriptional regulatory protein Sin3-like protein [Gracilaria domingensis]|nr:Transcriptional regulatory protein Sin3-like protein [Gracilaria domingensis]
MHSPPRSSPQRSPPRSLETFGAVLRTPVEPKRGAVSAAPAPPPPRRAAAPSPLRSLHASPPPPPLGAPPPPLPRAVLLPSSRASAVMQTLPPFQHAPPRRPSPPPSRIAVDPAPLYQHPLRVSISPLVADGAAPPPPRARMPPPPPPHMSYGRPLPHDARSLPPPHFDVYHLPQHAVQPRLVERAASPVMLPVLSSTSQQNVPPRRLHAAPTDAPEGAQPHAQSAAPVESSSAAQQSQHDRQSPARHAPPDHRKPLRQPSPPPQQQPAATRDMHKQQPPPLAPLPPHDAAMSLRPPHGSLPPPPPDALRSPSRQPAQSPPQQLPATKALVQPNPPHQPQHVPPRSIPHDGYAQPPAMPLHLPHNKSHWHLQPHMMPPLPHRPPPPHVLPSNPVADHPSYQHDPHWHAHHPQALAQYERHPPPRTHPSANPDPTKPHPRNNWPNVRFLPPPGTPPHGAPRLPHQPQRVDQQQPPRSQPSHPMNEAQSYPYQQRLQPPPMMPPSEPQQHVHDAHPPTGPTPNMHQRTQSPVHQITQSASTLKQNMSPTLSNVGGAPRASGTATAQPPSSRDESSPQMTPSTPPPATNEAKHVASIPLSSASDQRKRPSHRDGDRDRPTQQQLPPSQPPPPQQPLSAPQQGNEESVNTQRRELKVEDALAYLEKVKSQFSDQISVYNQFLDIMKEFKAQSIDTKQVIHRVAELFRGHKELILGFNTFLPPGYNICVTEGSSGVLMTGFEGPGGFSELPPARKVPSKNSTSRSNSKKKQNAANSNATASSVALSPKRRDSKKPHHTSSSTPGTALNAQHLQSAGADHPQSLHPQHPATSFDHDEKQHLGTQSLPSEDKYSGPPGKGFGSRRPLAKVEEDMRAPQTSGMPRTSRPKQEETQARAMEFERAIGFVTSIKERFADTPKTYEEFLETLTRFRSEQTSIREVFETVASLFGPHKDLLAQFKEFLPSIAITGLSDSKPVRSRPVPHGGRGGPTEKSAAHSAPPRRHTSNGVSKSRHRPRDMKFFDELKTRLGPSKLHLYTEFIKCLSLFSQQIVTREELLYLTSEILRDDLEAYNDFLDYLEQMANSGATVFDNENISSSISFEGEPSPPDQERLNFFKSHSMTEIAIEHGVELRGSYRRIPPDCPALEYTGRSMYERRTLNDTWINVTRGSEDYSFKFMRKNQSEDNLFRCEDDRYELDLVIETNAATIMKLETIEATISTLQEGDKKRHALAPNALSPIHFNAIQRIYGESGPEVVSQVKLNPFLAVPVVLKRLKEKDISWRRARMEMNRVWREVGERNFHRSLDHRSLCFKAVDKKDLSAKSLLSDILDPVGSVAARDAEVTRTRGYHVENGGGGSNHRSHALEAVAVAAKRSPDAPRVLELPFEAREIHDVVFDIITYIVEENWNGHVAEFRGLIHTFFDILPIDGESKGSEKVPTRVSTLYGDEAVYLMFRLYHFIYERIETARTLAQEQVVDREWRQALNEEGRKRLSIRTHSLDIESEPWHITKGLNGAEIDNKFRLGPETESPEEIFETFVGHTKAFAKGKLEGAKFEDKLRVLLGSDSYCLFTIDKAFQKLVKGIETVYQKESRSRPFCEMFMKTQSLLERCTRNHGKLDEEGCDAIQSVAVCRHIVESRDPGSTLMRFQVVDGEKEARHMKISVVGHTTDEAGMMSIEKEIRLRDEFLEFCSSFGHRRRHQRIDDEGENEEVVDEREESGTSKKRRRSENEASGISTKRRRKDGPEFLRFLGNPEDVAKRLERSQLVVENYLCCTLKEDGRLKYAAGTSDFFMNSSKKFRFASTEEDRTKLNEKSSWTQNLRSKMNIDGDGVGWCFIGHAESLFDMDEGPLSGGSSMHFSIHSSEKSSPIS